MHDEKSHAKNLSKLAQRKTQNFNAKIMSGVSGVSSNAIKALLCQVYAAIASLILT
jgi:hypothetical protein